MTFLNDKNKLFETLNTHNKLLIKYHEDLIKEKKTSEYRIEWLIQKNKNLREELKK